jgi:hypothetical protein
MVVGFITTYEIGAYRGDNAVSSNPVQTCFAKIIFCPPINSNIYFKKICFEFECIQYDSFMMSM